MEDTLVIVPCKYGPQSKINDCIASIKKNVRADIVVIDSKSEDQSYAHKFDVPVEFIDNMNYDMGAYLVGYRKFSNYKNYICIHDSFIFNAQFTPKKKGITPFRTFETSRVIGGRYTIRGRRDALKFIFRSLNERAALLSYGFDTNEQLEHFDNVCSRLNMIPPISWNGIFGPIFTIDNESIQYLSNLLTQDLLPCNKQQQMSYERILGLVAHQNLQVRQPYWGPHFTTPLEDEKFSKFILARK